MQNISIPDIIANLKGRRGYEEKKAKKLGYDCLEKYFEDKLANEAQLLAENEIKEEKLLAEKKALKSVPTGKKTCGCC
tara:strand:+ start:638 stop:871 length:234 start_codon:yes stop_codon:yes gene_type:complete